MTEPTIVDPSQILQKARTSGVNTRLAGALQRTSEPDGTPPAKLRLGYVQSYDPQSHTVSALIGDLLTPIPGIPVPLGVSPMAEQAGLFSQVSMGGTSLYTLLGMLSGGSLGPGIVRIRKPADQAVTNSATAVQDNDLKFYAQANRSYIYDVLLLVSQNALSLTADVRAGWIMPSGTSFSGGAIGPISSLAASASSSESTGAGANWRAQSNTVGTFPYGTDPFPSGTHPEQNFPIMVRMQGTIKVGATAGWCYVAWAQQTAQVGITTQVNEGSFMKVDITSELLP